MHLHFEENKIEKSIRVFQTNGITKVRIASITENGKVILANIYRKQMERDKVPLKEVCEVLSSEYQNWLYKSSPLRNLSPDQMQTIITNMKAIDVICIALQDRITSLGVLDSLDQFNEVAGDLNTLKQSMLYFTNKVSKAIGVDKTIEHGDIADSINELIDDRI